MLLSQTRLLTSEWLTDGEQRS